MSGILRMFHQQAKLGNCANTTFPVPFARMDLVFIRKFDVAVRHPVLTWAEMKSISALLLVIIVVEASIQASTEDLARYEQVSLSCNTGTPY